MIDAAAFTGSWPWRPVGMTARELASHLGKHGISRALVTPLEGIFWDDPQLANERLIESAEGLPLRLVPAVDPTFPSWRRDLETCLNRYGTRALRIFPSYRGFAVDHPASLELLELAGREGLTVIVQLRMLDARGHNRLASYPDVSLSAVLGVAALFPSTRIVLGGARAGEIRAASGALAQGGNVSVETSAVESMDAIGELIGAIGAGRVLFGTHTPLFTTRSALLKLEEAHLLPQESFAVTEGNARYLLERAQR